MQLQVTGHHVEVTEAMRAYVEKKMEKIVRHFDHVIDVHCVLSVEKLEQKYGEEADQQLITSKGNEYLTANFPEMDYIVKAKLRGSPESDSETATARTELDENVR